MKLVKRLSLLIAICICVTVGGVYATWIYTQQNDVADQHQHLSVALTESTFDGNYGTYNLDYTGLALSIDQKEAGDHTAVLKITGQITVTFTPGMNAPETVKENGIATTVQFGTNIDQASWTYEGTKIFTVDTEKKNVTWTKQDNGTFTYVITAEEVAKIIQLGDITLDTQAKYNAFNTELAKGKIGISVSDGITSTVSEE